jgi:hypothetical protein
MVQLYIVDIRSCRRSRVYYPHGSGTNKSTYELYALKIYRFNTLLKMFQYEMTMDLTVIQMFNVHIRSKANDLSGVILRIPE